MLGVKFRLQHLYKTLYFIFIGAAVFVELLNLLQYIRHLINGVVPALRRAAVAAYAQHAYLHPAPVAAVNAAVGRLGYNNKFGGYAVNIVYILPAHAVAVLLLHGAGNKYPCAFGYKAKLLHYLCAVNGAYYAAKLVARAASAYFGFGFIAFIRVEFPVAHFAQANRIYMRIESDKPFAFAHVAQHVAKAVYFNLIKANGLHLLGYPMDNAFLARAFAGYPYKVPQKAGHLFFVALRGLFYSASIHSFVHPFRFYILAPPVRGYYSLLPLSKYEYSVYLLMPK